MTTPPHPSPAPSPLPPVALAAAAVAVVAWVLALVRPWGDTGVDRATGGFRDDRPGVVLAGIAVVVVVATLVSASALRRSGRPASTRPAALAGSLVVALAGVGLVAVLAVTTAQVFPRDGGWWALVAVIACAVAGLAVAVSGAVRPTGRRGTVVATAVAAAVPVALVVSAVVVAPTWSTHVVDGRYPAAFSESGAPLTVTRVGWKAAWEDDTAVTVLGGRVVVATDSGGHVDARDCRLTVKALDAGTGHTVWTSARTLRCDGPRLAALDGDGATVRLTLRGESASGKPLEGAARMVYLGLEDGRDRTPAPALDTVQWWTEGFGLVQQGSSLTALDAATGATAWTRPLPTCADGRRATLQLPGPIPPGQLASRSPYDLGRPYGTSPVATAGSDVVLGLTCADAGVREVWLVDIVHGAGSDRVVALPTLQQLVGPDAAEQPGPDDLTGFLPWLDTVVAVVPVSAPNAYGTRAALVGVDLASGQVRWKRAPTPLQTVDLGLTDGSVQASGTPTAFGQPATTVLDVHTGAVLAQHDDADPPLTSVSLTGGRVQYSRTNGVSVVDAKTGATTGRPLEGCPPDTLSTAAPVLAGPGGVVFRCAPADSSGPSVIGLAP